MYKPEIKKKWIQKGVQNSFSGMYLTMLSIIQGVALSFLVSKVFDAQTGVPYSSPYGLEYLVMSLLTLLIIIVLWHSYFWLSVIASWVPTIWDSLFMFLIGSTELIAVKSIGNTVWFYAVAFIAIFGGFQYRYNVLNLQEDAWHTDTKDIGGWIRDYKTKKGFALLSIGSAILVATIFSHWFSRVKIFLYIGILIGLLYTILQHREDQIETLKKLK
jgi:hypothetical protein